VSLAAFAGQSIRIRFLYHVDMNQGAYLGISDAFGWFFDSILVRSGGATVLFEGAENGLPMSLPR
jgi:hypothetical protein